MCFISYRYINFPAVLLERARKQSYSITNHHTQYTESGLCGDLELCVPQKSTFLNLILSCGCGPMVSRISDEATSVRVCHISIRVGLNSTTRVRQKRMQFSQRERKPWKQGAKINKTQKRRQRSAGTACNAQSSQGLLQLAPECQEESITLVCLDLGVFPLQNCEQINSHCEQINS